MKLKSLILGSVAAAGLSTAGFAADLGVLTSLDVCDSLGISGLTISSADNCLAISGKVAYEFNWGDYKGNWAPFALAARAGTRNVIDNDAGATADLNNDWETKVETWLKFVGTASSDFGPASATIKLKSITQTVFTNEGAPTVGGDATTNGAGSNGAWIVDEAFVQVGDTTTLMAGKKGSVANFGDDEPFNWLGLFNSDAVDKGVMFAKDHPRTGGHVIQVVSSLGNGVTVKAGLENLDRDSAVGAFGGFYDGVTAAQSAGTLVGVVEYAGEGIAAHVTGLAGGILDGVVEDWAVHAGVTGTFDAFKIRAAGAYSANNVNDTYWNVLGSAEGNFDMFTIALSGEANGGTNNGVALANQAGFGASVGATVTEGVRINLGGRWFDENTDVANTEGYQVAAQVVAAVTETITLTGEIGVYGSTRAVVAPASQTDFYGKAELGWKPGGQFESSLGAEVHQNGAYKVTFKASKEFK
ncbi:hypothetical protein [Devosia chinhatensis]|uniref:Porin domain-containing protein n=1 Tax=Devosia chinhatensis TaxID=429727 RepID=A0A0F5FK93_9HYPH|nr:hypothetical protein [Devosia chinhatensis]KKB09213.1 hypothetical protein VE26_04260 [Devosia chinhatensis]